MAKNHGKKNNSNLGKAKIPKARMLSWAIRSLKSHKSTSRFRQALIRKLGLMRNKRAVYFLNAALLNSKEHGVRRGLAATALFEIGLVKGGPDIERLLRNAWVFADEECNYKLADHIHRLLVKLRKKKNLGEQQPRLSELEFAMIMDRLANQHQ